MVYESNWQRASKDTERFRSRRLWFCGVEVIGAGAIAGLTAWILWDRTILRGSEAGLITFGFFVVGFFIIYGIIFLWNLFRAPYRQLKEARDEIERLMQRPALIISYRDQKWGYPAAVDYPTRMVTIGIDYDPTGLMQVAKAFLEISNAPRKESWGFGEIDIPKREHKSIRFYLADEEAGIKKAKVVVLADNREWETNEFDLDIPPKSPVNLFSTSHQEGSQK